MSASSNPAVRPDRIMEMVWGYAPPIILATAFKLKVFDLLDAGPKTVEELAKASGNSDRGLRAIMNALVGFQFLAKNSRRPLRPDSRKRGVPGEFEARISRQVRRVQRLKMIQTWLSLPEIVRTGKPSDDINQQDAGEPFFKELVEPIFAMSYPATQAAGQALGIGERQKPDEGARYRNRFGRVGHRFGTAIAASHASPRRICPASWM